ncbi:MAG: tetratricopeptide repeat protein [Lachnospiraceae bacterium]|nr:tetratricopeptide repeat protein [Lachnospiraceae bacterium]
MKRKLMLAVLAAVMAFGMSGCLGKESGGELTKQGMAAIESLDYAAALNDFEQALQSGEDFVLAYRGQGLAYMGLARYQEAVDAFEEALSYTDQKMPETVQDLLLYKASAQFRMKDYEGTIESCDAILEDDEVQSADALYLRGASSLCQGEQDMARTDFDRAVALTPEDYTLYLNIYESYESQNLSAVGDEYLQTALNIVPKNAENYYCIGQIYFYLQQYDLAQNALISPVEEKYLPALYLMGRIYLAQEDYAHAGSMYETVRQEDGDSTETYNGLALCCLASGEYDQALEYIGLGLALEGEAGKQELYFNEIVAYERKLDFAMAKEKAQAYVQKYPTDETGQKELEFLSTR